MEQRLDEIRLGHPCHVVALEMDEVLKRRLEDFGFVPGTLVCPECRSPGGHGTVIMFRRTRLALRTRDLKRIRVCI